MQEEDINWNNFMGLFFIISVLYIFIFSCAFFIVYDVHHHFSN